MDAQYSFNLNIPKDDNDDFLATLKKSMGSVVSQYKNPSDALKNPEQTTAQVASQAGAEIANNPKAEESFKAKIVNQSNALNQPMSYDDIKKEDMQAAQSRLSDIMKGKEDAIKNFNSAIESAKQKKELDTSEKISLALVTLLPTAFGAAIGGKQGLAFGATAGGAAGTQAYQGILKEREDQRKADMESAKVYAEQFKDYNKQGQDVQADLAKGKREINMQALKDQQSAADRDLKEKELSSADAFRRGKIDVERAKLEIDRAKANSKEAKLNLSPAQKKVDEEFAKDYQDFVNQGGYTDVQKHLAALDDVASKLPNTDFATGPVISMLPDSVRTRLFPQSRDMQDKVEEVVQRNLRLVLGAQFTENEGNRLIARAYNPALDESVNAKRVAALADTIKKAAAAKTAAAQYYEENGTLQGYKGLKQTDLENMVRNFDKKPEAASQQSSPATSKPAVVKQNGIEYRLNPETGEYE